MFRYGLFFILFALLYTPLYTPLPIALAATEDLTCLATEEGAPQVKVTWYGQLTEQVTDRMKQRSERVEKLKTPEEVRQYQTDVRRQLIEQLGGFPERTPLNAQIESSIDLSNYRIEKLHFESQPGHRVTGNLYVPNGKGPFPAVIVSSGHSRTGKTADYNQRFGIAMAENGIMALCYDPIGQGERSQIVTPAGKPEFDATTEEHFLVGTGSILVGRNTATYRIWDAMRALDYLESRTDVNRERLGMMGCSGGGTLTSYVMALDERIYCAAPACYLTTFEHLVQTLGPQDSEQNIFAQLKLGIDQCDYVLLRTPKPTLISATTDDFFGISGTWLNYRQNKRIYTRLGFSERLEIVEADGTHGVQPENLSAIVHWMKRWLLNSDAQQPTPIKPFSEYRTQPEEKLLVTTQGQVLLDAQERSVFDLNFAIAQGLRAQTSGTTDLKQMQNLIREKLQIPPAESRTIKSNRAGKVQRDGYHIDKLVMRGADNFPLPALTFHPVDPSDSAYLYLSDGGKTADSQSDGPIEKIVDEGYVVVTVDLRGQGETADGTAHPRLGDWRTFYLAYLLGDSVVAAHTRDIISSAKWIANYQSEKPREVHLIANGRTAVAALHAVILEPDLFTSVEFRDEPKSWLAMVQSAANAHDITTTVHGILKHYDLPDLKRLLPKEKLRP
jgi:cephalosporin-C deacetylase-like acetyl esterase